MNWLMGILAATSVLSVAGDAAFFKVDNRRPAHQLEPGVVAAAVNHRFDEGKPGPRHGVGLEAWGVSGANLIPDGTAYTQVSIFYRYTATGLLTAGVRYLYVPGANEDQLLYGSASGQTVLTGLGVFTYDGTGIVRIDARVQSSYPSPYPVTARLIALGNTCGYGRFNDPNGTDNGVLLTDEWRTSDGGRGKAWRIYPGNVPQEIPLNGHDLWGTARLIQCDAQLVLLRHGRERHYFKYDAVNAGTDRVTLNVAPAWENGDDVVVYAATDDANWPGGPNLGAIYFVRQVVGSPTLMELYDTAAHARDTGSTTGRLDLPAASSGKFYVERYATNPGFYGNTPPPLRLCASDTQTAFEVGFAAVPTIAPVTGSDLTANTITAPSHGLQQGDKLTVTLSTDGALTQWAAPQSDHVLRLYDSQINALADDGSTGLYNITADAQTGSVKRYAASAAPMPGGTEGVYVKGRLIIINGRNLLISDALDILHFTPFAGTLPTNQSASGAPAALLVGGNENLLILNENSVQEFVNLETPASWVLRDVTREYGCLAPLAALRVGTDSWFLSRRGVASVAVTIQGEQQGVAVPVSQDIQRRFDSVDWRYARYAAAADWNNRVFFAVPLKAQEDTPINNGVLVFNTLAGGWEDLWSGDYLTPYAFARLTIAGEERLTFATPDGLVCYLSDDFQDFNGAIETELTTRAYFDGQRVLAVKLDVNWDTWNPSLTVLVQSGGQGESVTLAPDPVTYDRTKYLLAGAPDYDPDASTTTTFDAPHRQDYSPAAGELLSARLDAHQNLTEHFRLRLRDRAPQVVIRNAQGSVKINSIELAARPIGSAATKET